MGLHRAGLLTVGARIAACGAITAAMVAGAATTASAAPPVTGSTAGVIYDNIPRPLPGNLPSESFEAKQASELGGLVSFAGTAPHGAAVTVIMSSWGCTSGAWNTNDCVTTPGATFPEPITLNIYNADTSDAAGSEGSHPGSLVGTVTKTFNIPFRPSADSRCTGDDAGKWFDAARGTCNNGLATPIVFDTGDIALPNQAVIAVAYDTTHFGYNPYGEDTACFDSGGGCGYDSLNVGLTAPPSVGSDPLPNDVYFNSSWTGGYCDAENPGLGTLALDTGCWGGVQPAIEVQEAQPTKLVANPSIARILPDLQIDLTLSAVLTSGNSPVVGEPITFSAAGGAVCTAFTNRNGEASCGGILPGVLRSVLGLGYQATFHGDGGLAPAVAGGPLLVLLGLPI